MRYRRRAWRPRRWRRRWFTRRSKYGRRFRVRGRRRRKVSRKTFKLPKRSKKVTTFWNPATVKKCTITGWTIGILSSPMQMEQRTWNTVLYGAKKGQLTLVGGGVSVRVFSLQMLWWEHQLFRNWWSNTNDGYDLARYFGTKVYLPPHRDNTYIFWWDTDYNQIQRSDYWRAHPAALLGYKNKVIVQSQIYGNRHKMKKVFIRPPATNNNEWRFQNSWMDLGLFVYGLTVIDWFVPFSRSTKTTLEVIDMRVNDGSKGVSATMPLIEGKEVQYAWYADFPKGNRTLMATRLNASQFPAINGTDGTGWKYIEDADDLPYWMVFYGQNENMFMDNEGISSGETPFFKIYYPKYLKNSASLTTGNFGPKDQKEWMIITKSTAKFIGQCGPFLNTSNQTSLQIPILYRSYWQWGGATYSPQFVKDPMHFAPKQVTVKNPATITTNIIRPWDCDNHGILTKEALDRYLKPDGESHDRRLAPGEEDGWPRWSHDSPSESSSEEDQETPESDEEGPTSHEKAIETLRRRVSRERRERHNLHKFLKSLIKRKKHEMGGG
uniref:Capsid protein n=1 Tax=Paguma larvata torque teno virus TaxID=2219036 RepID=A0A348BSQ1_9VIRU|nr:hypothetical protein [Paguma larvata torque teno virus]